MIYLPQSPRQGGPMLAAYIAADPHRLAIFNQIAARLGPAGLLGDRARFWTCQRPQRRAVLRGILLCLHEVLPNWTKDNAASKAENHEFIAYNREAYHSAQTGALADVG